MSKSLNYNNLYGFRCITGKDLLVFRKVSKNCTDYLARKDYQEIITPLLGEWTLFVGDKNRPVSIRNSSNLFSLITSVGEAIALRYENTMPVCSYVVSEYSHGNLKLPSKYFYISNQFRNEHNVSETECVRLREFNQVGWEIFGNDSTGLIEIICDGLSILKDLGLKPKVSLSNVNIIGDVFDYFKVDSFNQRLISSVFDKESLDRTDQTLFSLNINENAKHILSALKKMTGKPKDILNEVIFLEKKFMYDKLRNYVEELVKVTNEPGLSEYDRCVEIDLSMIRNREFYSGTIFQYYLSGNSYECGGGGEYNRIISSLGGPKMTAVGAAFGLERLIYEYSKK